MSDYAVTLHDADEDARVVQSHRQLMARLQQLREVTRSFDLDFVHRCEQLIYDHRARFKSIHGLAFPDLAAFVLPSVRSILFFRRDLDDGQIRGKLIEVVRALQSQGIRVSSVEFAAATARCWPGYRPPIEELRRDPKVKRRVLT